MLTLSPNTPERQRSTTHLAIALLVAFALLAGCDGGGVASDTVAVAAASRDAMSSPKLGDGLGVRRATPQSHSGSRPLSAVGRTSSASPTLEQAPMPSPPMSAPAAIAPGTMLVRTARASVAVESLGPAVAAVQRAVVRHGATLSATTIRTGRNEEHQAVLAIRVPNQRFDSLLAGLDALGRVESVDAGSQDVGEEFVDVEARLANARRLEARFLELLARRTGNLGEVLRVEAELSRVRGEIERAEGRKRYLERAVALSTIELLLHEPASISGAPPGRNPIAAAFATAWRYLIATVAFGIASLGVLVPVAVVTAGAVVLARRFVRRAPRGDMPA